MSGKRENTALLTRSVSPRMNLAHYEPLSLSDFPERLATTVFTTGCNMACPYCHNPELVHVSEATPRLDEEEFFAFLERRRKRQNGVCVTGGEPALQPGLPDFIRRIRATGYAVKLDTNGSYPDVLLALLTEGLLDYVAMDVKAPLTRYAEFGAREGTDAKVKSSIDILGASTVRHEFRTTAPPLLLHEEDLMGIAALLPAGSHYVLQDFVATKVLDASLASARGYGVRDLLAIASSIGSRFPALDVRTRNA